MKSTKFEIDDISKSMLLSTKLEIDVLKLFKKIKTQCIKSHPSNCDKILNHLYDCIKLFNNHKIDSNQLLNSVKSLFENNFPHLYYDFIHMMKRIEIETQILENRSVLLNTANVNKIDFRKDLKFSNLTECGPSYRLLPYDYKHKQCSGRHTNKISLECLNDNYICFPSMTSEDTSAVSSKKNIHEEQIHRLEDERYEVDMFQEINKYALKHLSDINKKMEAMSRDEKLKFQLDENVGGSSAILMRKAIYRIYGDATDNMIEGLKVRPKMAIPLVISRMQEKAKEWNQIHSKFKMVWEDRANKHYWQSLDYQGDWVKRDTIYLKRSTFFSQIESLSKGFKSIRSDFFNNDFVKLLSKVQNNNFYNHMIHTQYFQKGIYGNLSENTNNKTEFGPHLTLLFPPESELFLFNFGISVKDIIENSNALIINQINLQSNLSKEDKQFLIDFIYQIIGSFFGNSESKTPSIIIGSNREQKERKSDRYATSPIDRRIKYKRYNADEIEDQTNNKNEKLFQSHFKELRFIDSDEISSKPLKYDLMIGNSYIYTFLRLYHVLIDRLTILKIHGLKIAHDENESDDMSINDDSSSEDNDRYSKVFKMLFDSNESNSETMNNVDNKIRSLFTTKAFLWFTIPRLVQQIVKISQQIMCAGLESSKDMLDLYCFHSNSFPRRTGGLMINRELYFPTEKRYVKEAIDFCINQGLLGFLFIYFRQEGRLLIQMIDTVQMKALNESPNTYSDCESPNSPEQSKTFVENRENILNFYENFIEKNFTTKLQLSKTNKIFPMFLMKNLKKGVRKLTDQLLEYWKHESLRRSFPSMQEIELIKSDISSMQSKLKENKAYILCYLQNSFRELYRSAFIGNGEIYNFLFEKKFDQHEKTGVLFKRSIFCNTIKKTTKRNFQIDEILFSKFNSTDNDN